MPFLPPNQQRQSAEGTCTKSNVKAAERQVGGISYKNSLDAAGLVFYSRRCPLVPPRPVAMRAATMCMLYSRRCPLVPPRPAAMRAATMCMLYPQRWCQLFRESCSRCRFLRRHPLRAVDSVRLQIWLAGTGQQHGMSLYDEGDGNVAVG